MGRKQGPRKGSMQVWPRKRSHDLLPRVNWKPLILSKINEKSNLLGFIGYKAGMKSAFVKDNTPDSMTKNKKIIIPVTVIECPPMKIYSVRLYKDKKVLKDLLNDNLDKELKRVVKFSSNPSKIKGELDKLDVKNFDDIRLVVYSQPKKTGLKKTPDIAEIGLSGKKEEKLEFAKQNLGKEISIADVFVKGVVDVHAITKGKGFQGSVKRFGIRLRSHKAEKGQRRVGSIGAWHPTGIRFRVPMPGQMGFHTRIVYNNVIVSSKRAEKDAKEKDIVEKSIFDNYGKINSDYLVVLGSVQGSQKRQLMLTSSLRPTKNQVKKQYELIELR